MINFRLIMALCLPLLACHPKNNSTTNNSIQETEIALVESAMDETVQFSPPVLKDDKIKSAEDEKRDAENFDQNKKIIKEGRLSVKVPSIEPAKKNIDKLVAKYNCYYENESFENVTDNRTNYDLKIRVPVSSFDTFLSSVEKASGELRGKSITAKDVTAEYRDSEVRLNSKKLFRQRYYDLLAKAASVKDILEIEENIRNLQEEIESQEGRLKFLDKQVSYSTIDIYLYEEKVIDTSGHEELFPQKIRWNLQKGWLSVVAFVLWIIAEWPLLLLLFCMTIFIKKLRKRKNKLENRSEY